MSKKIIIKMTIGIGKAIPELVSVMAMVGSLLKMHDSKGNF